MSAPKRFLVKNVSEETELTGDEFRHAKSVLRLSEGDEVTVFDGSGTEYTAVISRVSKSAMTLHVIGKHASGRDPQADMYLLVGALKGDKTELVVQKATELGVKRIGVFSSRYCAAYVNENKIERFRRVASEAAKQCLRATVPAIDYYETLSAALSSAQNYRCKLFACEFAKQSDIALSEVRESCALAVGSEGGFTQEEFEEARAQGFAGVTLGKRILRAETAAISLLSVVAYFAGELK